MLGRTFGAIILLSALWVYLDASRNKIGKSHALFNWFSAGAWALACVFIWPIAIPLYLVNRKALIEQAKREPVEVEGRWLIATLLALCCLPYLVILNDLIAHAIFTASVVWVYLDATGKKIGSVKVARDDRQYEMSAGEWAFITLVIWAAAFPTYLYCRDALIERAKRTPVPGRKSSFSPKTGLLAYF